MKNGTSVHDKCRTSTMDSPPVYVSILSGHPKLLSCYVKLTSRETTFFVAVGWLHSHALDHTEWLGFEAVWAHLRTVCRDVSDVRRVGIGLPKYTVKIVQAPPYLSPRRSIAARQLVWDRSSEN
jgi:hypothetical protein